MTALDASLIPLGMENEKIKDSQIKVSHFYWLSSGERTHYSGLSSRLNSQETGYLGAGWRPDPTLPYSEQWLEVMYSSTYMYVHIQNFKFEDIGLSL